MPTAITPSRVSSRAYKENNRVFRGILTGTGAINHTVTPGYPFKIAKLELHLNAAPTTSQDFVVSIDAGDGSAYDIVLVKEDLSANSVADFVWTGPDEEFEADDVILVTWTNTDGRTYGLRVIYEHT